MMLMRMPKLGIMFGLIAQEMHAMRGRGTTDLDTDPLLARTPLQSYHYQQINNHVSMLWKPKTIHKLWLRYLVGIFSQDRWLVDRATI